MSATLRITCTHLAPKGWDWANEANKRFRHPTALVDGVEIQLNWDATTDISVSPDTPHAVRVFMEIFGLHWCSTEIAKLTIAAGETQCYEYKLELMDRQVNRGHLTRI